MQKFKLPKDRVLEKHVEEHLRKGCVKRGWTCDKFTSPSNRSVPDRIVTAPVNRILFVELKAPGKKATDAQLRDHAKRRALGCYVIVLDTKKKVDNWIESVEMELI